jgi:nitric-oxide synthase
MGVLLRDTPLSELQLHGFRANGRLLLEAPEVRVEAGSHVICACTGTSGTALREAARQCDTLPELQQLTAAGTVCGGCLNRLPLFLNQLPEVLLCRVITGPLATGSVQVRLRPIEPRPLPPWRVGEHLLVEGLIDGRWVGRSYTLTGGDAQHYELGVKREPGGVFSNWLAETGPADLVRISPPQGNLLPAPEVGRPLLYLVAGIGVTPAIAGCRRLRGQRALHVAYTYRGEDTAAYLDELREAAATGAITLLEHDSRSGGRLQPQRWLEALAPLLLQPAEVVVCGPEAFNQDWQQRLTPLASVEVRLESFSNSGNGRIGAAEPGTWRLSPEDLAARARVSEERFGPCPPAVPVGQSRPLDEARSFLDSFRREVEPALDLQGRLAEVEAELRQRGQWRLSHAELRHGTRLAWRQAERCVGRLYWQGLELFDRRELSRADDIAEALFEHLRFAFNGGDLRPAISVFDPGEPGATGPRIWNPQLLRYAGYRSPSGRQIGDPAQNELTARMMQLGWRPSGEPFELLPLVIQTATEGPRLFDLPADCRQEVMIRHPGHPWLEELQLRWYAVPAVSEMALDVGGNLFRMAPFNGWYLDTEIAARNFSDTNRFNLLPRIAEGLGLDLRDNRSLWRDHAQLMLAEAVLYSFDQARVRISDHHGVGHEFLEFCRSEQSQGREPQAEWSWVVPPMSGSLNVLYQEPFENRAFKPAFVPQPPAWQQPAGSGATDDGSARRAAAEPARCPFSS